MDALLNDVEVRVLGSLAEKQVTTPDYYPLTLNALVHACNQISNREPVMQLDERAVTDAVETLRGKNLVYIFYGAESRVPKYKHMMREVFGLSPQELAAMCVLMLRGPQTVGEVRGRTVRLYDFVDLPEVEATLEGLAHRDEPLITKLPRRPGQKDARYAQLLAGAPAVEETGGEGVTPARASAGERIARLEAEVERLHQEVAELCRQLADFRRQFE
ncbi:MAG TPA: YceH family protein [Pyrinomonadaceae bacterium]|nr:YceH family protein [Pyrinomonadaceae bacterium]